MLFCSEENQIIKIIGTRVEQENRPLVPPSAFYKSEAKRTSPCFLASLRPLASLQKERSLGSIV